MSSPYSASKPDTLMQATVVPLSVRPNFWQTHFGTVKGFVTFEVVIFTIMASSVMSTLAAIGNTAYYLTAVRLFILI